MLLQKRLENHWSKGPFSCVSRETTSGDLSKASLETILIHLLWNLCVLGAGNSAIRCFNQEASDVIPVKKMVTSVSLNFSMELVYVVTHAHQQEFRSGVFLSPHQESSESAVFFYHAKGAFYAQSDSYEESLWALLCFLRRFAVFRGKDFEFSICQ